MSSEKDFSEIVSGLAKKRGFYWGPSPEIYGGSAGFYDLGPLGKLLKNRLENVIRTSFVKANFWEVECPTVSPEIVWKASGHLDGFIDPLTKCTKCEQVYRADNLVEELADGESLKGLSLEEMTSRIQELGIQCPKCKSELGSVEQYNLMLKTTLGLDQTAYMRPETATSTYLLFRRLLTFFRDKLPAMVFQIGNAYRNEISPRQGMLRLREFTQVEGQIFILDADEMNWAPYEEVKTETLPLLTYQSQESGSEDVQKVALEQAVKKGYFQKPAYAWCVWLAHKIFSGMGFDDSNMRLRQHLPTERAHYAADAWDVELHTKSFGWVECCGIHDRGNYDLSRHQEFSKQKLSVKVDKKPVVPNVLEIAFGVERPLFCLIDNCYDVNEKGEVWLRFPPHLAPIQAAVFPLMGKEELVGPAAEIYHDILDSGLVTQLDQGGSIGRRYRRQDEIGTPFCITVDYDTLEDDTVTLRERDSMQQVRIKRSEVVPVLHQLVKREITFSSLTT